MQIKAVRCARINVLGIVEIEERDFYFEISPEDYQDEEANICNNKKA